MSSLVDAKNLSKFFEDGSIQAVNGISISLDVGTSTAITGPSGCGKSTLLNLIGGLDVPSSGSVLYSGRSMDDIGSLDQFRRDYLGFVFQFHHLVPALTLRENVEAAMLPNKNVNAEQRRLAATYLLEKLGVLNRADLYSAKLSGGERQRGAVARALINKPKLILADEPTGNVDFDTAKKVMEALHDHVKNCNAALLIATHDPNIAQGCDIELRMADGIMQ
jgi:lipoprotein-releasing system ATP-binding protein